MPGSGSRRASRRSRRLYDGCAIGNSPDGPLITLSGPSPFRCWGAGQTQLHRAQWGDFAASVGALSRCEGLRGSPRKRRVTTALSQLSRRGGGVGPQPGGVTPAGWPAGCCGLAEAAEGRGFHNRCEPTTSKIGSLPAARLRSGRRPQSAPSSADAAQYGMIEKRHGACFAYRPRTRFTPTRGDFMISNRGAAPSLIAWPWPAHAVAVAGMHFRSSPG